MGVVVVGTLVASPCTACADEYNFTVFSYPGSSLTIALGINNNRDIFGGLGEPFETGFLYQNGNYSLFSGIVDINDKGMILFNSPLGPAVFFNEQLSLLNVPGSLVAFNNYGTVLVSGGFVKDGIFYPVNYPGSVSTTVRDINDLDEVVGTYVVGTTPHGFLYKDGVYTTIDFPGSINSHAYGINNYGVIVGDYYSGYWLGIQGFVYQDGSFETLDAFNEHSPETQTTPRGINDFGDITGTQNDGPFGMYASFVATPVPEPGTLGLLGIGLMTLAGAVRHHFPHRKFNMRRILASCVLSLALLPIAAHADTIDDFTLVGQGHTITYSLPNSAIVMNHPHAVTLNASAPATIDGVPGYNVSGEYYLPGFPSLPSIVLSVPSSINGGDLTLYGQWVLQVSEIIPIDDPSLVHPNDLLVAFAPGTYVLHTLLGTAPFPAYTLTIAAESAPTPEPSTFALFGTGLLGAIAAVRRHVHRRWR
jgi:hypothetical protein